MNHYFCTVCGESTNDPIVPEIGEMLFCPNCMERGGLISKQYLHIHKLFDWLEEIHSSGE